METFLESCRLTHYVFEMCISRVKKESFNALEFPGGAAKISERFNPLAGYALSSCAQLLNNGLKY